MAQTASWVEPSGEDQAAGLHKYNRSNSPYERYMDEQGIPIISGIGVYDTRDVELGDWSRLGARGAFLYLAGHEDIKGMFILGVPGRGATKADRHMYDEFYVVIEGRGSTEVWGESGFNFNRLELPGLGLIGWLESSQVPIELKGGRATNIDGALYVASLPIELPKGFEGEIPAPIVAKRQLGANTASRQQYGSYDLSPGESLALQFSLPLANGRMLLDRLYLNVDGRFRGGNPSATAIGDISLFNWRTSEWEDWSVSYGVNEFMEPARFISGAGDVRIRYTFRPAPDSRTTGVSFTRFDVTALGLVR
jgi:hypothetical protein